MQVLLAFGRDDVFNFVLNSEVYNPATNNASRSGAVVSGRIYHAAVALQAGAAVYAAGGAWHSTLNLPCPHGWVFVCVCVSLSLTHTHSQMRPVAAYWLQSSM